MPGQATARKMPPQADPAETAGEVPAGGACYYREVNEKRFRYFIRETASAEPPLLICNGLGQSIEILYPLIGELTGRSIVTFDIPGVGRSEYRDDISTIPDYAACAAELMAYLDIDTYDILGISWGGCLAQQLAHDHPERVRKLVLGISSAGGIGSWWGTPLALSEIFFPLRYVSKTYGNFIGPLMYGGEAIFCPNLFRQYARHAIAPTPAGYYTQVRAMCTWTSLPWLSRLAQPALVLAGQYDGLIPVANQILLANNIPTSELHIFPAGHLLMFTKRREVGRLMTRFLAQ